MRSFGRHGNRPVFAVDRFSSPEQQSTDFSKRAFLGITRTIKGRIEAAAAAATAAAAAAAAAAAEAAAAAAQTFVKTFSLLQWSSCFCNVLSNRQRPQLSASFMTQIT